MHWMGPVQVNGLFFRSRSSDRLLWQQTQKQAFGARLLAVSELVGNCVIKSTAQQT